MDIWKALVCATDILFCALRPRWQAGRNIRTVINKIFSKIDVGDIQVLLVYKLLEMIADKAFHLVMGHTCFGVNRLFELWHAHTLSPDQAALLEKAALFSFK